MKLLKNFAIIGIFTIFSRISGMTREILVSYILGAGWISDAFVVALRFPNFFRQFFAEGAFNAAFIPYFSKTLEKDGKDAAYKLAQNVFSFLTIVLIVFCGVIIFCMPQIIHIIAPGFSNTPERLNLSILLVQITFPYLFFVSLSCLLSGILNAFNRFALGAAIPITANIFMISALVSYDWMNVSPVIALSVSLTLSGVTQLIILYFAVKKMGFHHLLIIPKLTASTLKILKLMIPGSISTGIMQINLLLSMILASVLPTGSLSYLFYADRLNQLPLALFGISLGTALLPQLSKLWQKDSKDEALHLQETALIFALQLSIPSAIALYCLAQPIVDLLFGHGKFGLEEVRQTAPALSAFALGLPDYVMGKIFTTTFFSCGDTKTPVKVAILTVILNLILTMCLMHYLLHVGMALATSLSAWANVMILGFILKKNAYFRFSKKTLYNILKIVLLSSAMGFIITSLSKIVYVPAAPLKDAVLSSSLTIITGLTFYCVSGYFLGFFKNLK
jgi:putative peptidoglycan lipid II flippase